MLFSPQATQKIEFLTYDQGRPLPGDRIVRAIYASMRSRRLDKVAVMADWETLEKLKPLLDAEDLDVDSNFHWSGTQRKYSLKKDWKRVQLGDYEQWYRWFMQHQRFRAFHVVVMVEPLAALKNEELGGYLNGFLARLMAKVIHKVVVVQTHQQTPANDPDKLYVRAALMAMLYGTRLSFDELAGTARMALVPLGDQALKGAKTETWLWERLHSRYQLTDVGEEFLEGMRPPKPTSDQRPIEPELARRKRSGPRCALPREMLKKFMMEDLAEEDWVTPYGEWVALIEKIQRLGHKEGSVIWNYFWGRDMPREEMDQAITPSHRLLRRILRSMAADNRLETRTWFREIGRPTTAYFLPGRAPFLGSRCGQCAFYVSLRRRCRLWWLVNKKRVFFDERWKQAGSQVSRFDIHKMRYASRIGPHSSACTRFIDKKRDHLRKAVPEKCEICGEGMLGGGVAVTCRNCRTRYVRFRGRVKVLTAYEHEYERMYHEITGGDAKADLEAWKRDTAVRLPRMLERGMEPDDLDMLADEAREREEEPPRLWPQFTEALQEKVDWLAQSSDIARRLSIAMAQSALNATRRIATFAKLDEREMGPAISLHEKYLALIKDAAPSSLFTYEALVMKQYWFCYNLALKKAMQWFGPRKKSRFVREFVGDPAGRARGYSAVDAAINYLHQRRLRQAERLNAKVGFAGTCDGFLHRERYNSRRMGLLLDMIDPFKFADREVLLAVVLNGGITWRDFRIEADRRGSNFYYPADSGRTILDRAGRDADYMLVIYENRQMSVAEAYKAFASNLLKSLILHATQSTAPIPFIFATPEAQ